MTCVGLDGLFRLCAAANAAMTAWAAVDLHLRRTATLEQAKRAEAASPMPTPTPTPREDAPLQGGRGLGADTP